MNISEKIAYLKGLMEGLKFDTDTNEGKIISSIVDILGDMATEIEYTQSDIEEIGELCEELDHDLGDVEETLALYDDYCDCDCCDDDCDCCDDDCDCCDDDEDMEFEYYDEDGNDIDTEDFICPNCNETIAVESSLVGQTIKCPNCEKEISTNK